MPGGHMTCHVGGRRQCVRLAHQEGIHEEIGLTSLAILEHACKGLA